MGIKNSAINSYLAVAGSCLAVFWQGTLAFGLPGVAARHWEQAYMVGKGQVGATMFMLLAGVGSFMYLSGRWQFRLGLRRSMALGTLLAAVNMAFLAYAPSMAAVYAWAYLLGMFQAFVYVPALTTAMMWHPGRQGLVSGAVSLCFAGSAAVMSPVMQWMLAQWGYEAMCLAVGLGVALTGLLGSVFTAPPAEERPGASPGEMPPSMGVRPSLSSPSFWLLWSAVALMGAGGIAMVTLSTSFGLSRGFPAAQAVIILTVFNLGSGISRLIMGYASDHFRRTVVMSITFLAAGVSYLILPWLGPAGEAPWAEAVLAGVIGFAFGTLWAVAAPVVVECFGPRHFGEMFGLLFTAYGFLSGALGPSLGGLILDLTNGNYLPVFSYLGVMCLAAGFIITRVRPAAPL